MDEPIAAITVRHLEGILEEAVRCHRWGLDALTRCKELKADDWDLVVLRYGQLRGITFALNHLPDDATRSIMRRIRNMADDLKQGMGPVRAHALYRAQV